MRHSILLIFALLFYQLSFCQNSNKNLSQKEYFLNIEASIPYIQKNLPMYIDKNKTVRFDSLSFSKSNKTYNSYYTMKEIDLTNKESNFFNINETKKVLDEQIMKSEETPLMKKFGVQFYFYYYDKNGLLIKIIKADYK
jgi:hypothetical protein